MILFIKQTNATFIWYTRKYISFTDDLLQFRWCWGFVSLCPHNFQIKHYWTKAGAHLPRVGTSKIGGKPIQIKGIYFSNKTSWKLIILNILSINSLSQERTIPVIKAEFPSCQWKCWWICFCIPLRVKIFVIFVSLVALILSLNFQSQLKLVLIVCLSHKLLFLPNLHGNATWRANTISSRW